MIAVEGLYKTYNKGTVNESVLFTDFSLALAPGSFTSVVGSNGSGKTTLLNLICGSLAMDRGTIRLGERDITPLKEYQRARYIGRVFQDPAKGSCANMTILENLSIAGNKGKRFGLTRGVNKARMNEYRGMLEQLRLGLENKLDMKVGLLSGGQRQALALLTATMTPIELLILDEHTAALDPNSSETIMALTNAIVREKGVTTLMVTHNLRFAVEYGDRVLMMHEGSVVLDQGGKAKANVRVETLLEKFNQISIECGN